VAGRIGTLNNQQPKDQEWTASGDDNLKETVNRVVDLVLSARLAEVTYPDYNICRNVDNNPGAFLPTHLDCFANLPWLALRHHLSVYLAKHTQAICEVLIYLDV
jgi:hypothetical protein